MVMVMAATRRPLALARHVRFTLDEAAVERDDAAVLDAAALVAHVPAATATRRSSGHGSAHRVSVPVSVLVLVLVPQRVTLTDTLFRGSVDFNKSRLMMMMGMMMMMVIAAEPRVCAMVVLRLQTFRVCAAAVYLRAVARVERVGAARFTIAAVPSATEHAISPFRPEPLLCRAPLVDKGAIVLKPSVSCRLSIGRDAPQASS